MAETKQTFAGLIRINTSSWEVYNNAKVDGRIVFAEVSTNDASYGKYIWANGIEYKVGDDVELDDVSSRLYDLSTYVYTQVDTSIDNISTRLHDLSTYVHTQVDTSIDNISTRLNETSTRLNDASNRLSHTITNASLASSVDGSIATLVLTTTHENGSADTQNFTIKGNDAFVQLNQLSDASVGITLKISNVSTATQDASGLATAYDVQQYVLQQISTLESALEFKGSIPNDTSLNNALSTGSKGDVYVASETFTHGTQTIDKGDMIILTTDALAGGAPSEFILIERNLDGAVIADGVLRDDYIVLGNGNQKVKDSGIQVADLSVAMKNANSALQDVSITTNSSYVTVTKNIVSVSTGKVTVDLTYATLADASNGSTGIAMAEDVYKELADVEYTMASAITKIGESTGLDANLEPGWTNPSIGNTSSHREVIEQLWSKGESDVEDLSTRINDVSIHLSHVDASVQDLSTSVVKKIIGEASESLERPYDAYVRVDVSRNEQNTYTIDSSVQLAEDVSLLNSSITRNAHTGLATDGYVKDYVQVTLEWAVIDDGTRI